MEDLIRGGQRGKRNRQRLPGIASTAVGIFGGGYFHLWVSGPPPLFHTQYLRCDSQSCRASSPLLRVSRCCVFASHLFWRQSSITHFGVWYGWRISREGGRTDEGQPGVCIDPPSFLPCGFGMPLFRGVLTLTLALTLARYLSPSTARHVPSC